MESWEAHAYYISFDASLLFVSESFEGIAVIGIEGPHPSPSGSVCLRQSEDLHFDQVLV